MDERKLALITGGAQGLGFADATRFLEGGYRIVIADQDAARAQTASERLGEGVYGWQLDVRDPEAVRATFDRVTIEFERLDVLVNNAGISRPDATTAVSEDEWQRMIDIHLGGTFRCSRAAYPLLAQRGGSIVNVSSIQAILGQGKRASYAAAKGGIEALTRELAMEWVGEGIRVNAVAPGVMETDILKDNIARGVLDPTVFNTRIPMGRMGRPSEIADAVFFLADTATYVTGQTLVVDGGFTVSFAW